MALGIDFDKLRRELNEENRQRYSGLDEYQRPVEQSPIPKHEYSTDSLSMLDMSGMGSSAMVNVLTDTAQDVTDYAKGSNAYFKYLASDEEKKREAKVISIETGIPVNALLASDENMAKGRSVQEYTKKRMALAPEGVNEFDMNDVYVKFPGLKDIVNNPNMTDNDVAIAMHNIEDLTKVKDEAEAFSLGYAADKANYRIGELGMMEFLGGKMTDDMKKEIASIKKSIPEQKSMPNFFDDPLTVIAGGTGANIYHMNKGMQRGSHLAATALAAGVGVSFASGGTLAVPAMGAAVTTAGIGFRYGMAEDMFLNSAGRHYYEYSEMKAKNGEKLLTKDEARAFAAIAAGLETGVEFWNYGQVMSLLGVNYKREIMEIVAKANGDQNMLKSGLVGFLKTRGAQAAKTGMTEAAEEAVQDVSDKAVHNAIVSYAPQSAHRKYTGTEFVKGALEASAEAMPGIIGLGMVGGAASSFKSVRDFAMLQKEQSDIFYAEMKLSRGLAMVKNLQANMAESKLFKKNPEIYQAVVKSAVENTEFKEVRVDTELALQDEEGAAVFNQLVEEMGLEQEEVNAIIENKADLVVPTEIYAQTVMNNDKFDQYISFDEKGHSVARKKYYMAVAEDMAKSINLEQEEKQAELIDSIITANFPEAGIEQDMGAAIIMQNPSNPREAWRQMKRDIDASINARLGDIVKKLEEGMSRGVHMHYDEEGYATKRQSDNDQWYSDFYKQNKRKPNKRELLEMARDIYKGNGMKYGMAEYQFEATEDMQEDFDALDNAFDEMYALEDIKEKVNSLTASEMAVVRALTPSGYKVYQAARKQFESGNADVQKAGRMNAILFARYADRMADNIEKITGKPYTAEDYMRERTHIVADATEVDESGLEQKENSQTPLDTFYTVEVTGNEFGEYKDIKDLRAKAVEWYANNLQGTVAYNVALGEVVINENVIDKNVHFSGSGKREMKSTSAKIEKLCTVKYLREMIENANFITEAASEKDKHAGEHFYYLYTTVVYKGKKRCAVVNVKKNNQNQLSYYNHVVFGEDEYKKREGYLREALGSRSTNPSQNPQEVPSVNNSIPEDSKIFNQEKVFYQVYNQTAYHGSPHTFDTFDLGAIGTGEGRQAHGWGLYFAQDKKVSEGYQSRLIKKDNVVVRYDGKENVEIAQALKHFAGGSVYSALIRGTRDNAKIAEEIAKIVTTLRAGYRSDISFIEFLSKHIERIEENPKLSIAKFLKETLKEDADRLKGIVDSAKYVAKMDGRRANINDVLDSLKVTLRPFADKREWETRNADILESIDLNKLEIVGATGSLFEVDVPENDVLLDEDKPLTEQPLKVRKAILEYYRQRPKDYNVPKSENDLGTMNGKQFYKDVVFQMYNKEGHRQASERAASETLNALGIKGITYEGRRDGRCFVVFDDKAISVIERYNQSVRGQTRISGMERVVSLFEQADKSTFVHELGHVALADLKMLAEMEGAPAQLVRDWQTVKEWLGYKDSQGFTREQHEKFARGFEAYLRTGEAPVRGLKAVFRTFKKWLCDIYADFVQLGGKPSPEVQAVMARMLASEQEIEAEAKIQGIESITKKKGMKILDDTTQAMYERWVYEAKEEAKEKVLKIAMKDIGDDYAEQRQAVIDDMRKGIEDSLKQEDIFRAEECVRLSGSTAILPTLGYTEESYKVELEARGGSLNAAVERELQEAVADLDSEQVSAEHIREEAQKALSSSKYKAMLLTLEYEAIARKESEESRLDKSVDKALEDIEKDLRGEEEQPKGESAQVKSLKQRIADLKYTYRWREAEMKLINQMQKQAAEAEAKRDKEEAVEEAVGKAQAKAEKDREKILDTVRQLKESIASSKEGVRLVRDAIEGQMLLYKKAAKIRLAEMPIRQATATYSWRHKERMKGSEVAKLMAKGKWKEAKQAKLEQVMFSYFAEESARIKADVEKKANRLKKRSNSIAKGNVKLAADERYFYNHLLYVFGINRRDAIVPQEWQGSKSIDAMFKRYSEGHEAHFLNEAGEFEIPQFITGAAGGNDVYRTQVDIAGRKKPVAALGYGALTKDEWDGLYDILTRVYTIGKNANRLYTVIDENGKEVSFEDAAQRIADGIRKNVRVKETEDTTGATEPTWLEQKVAYGKRLVGELIKPETIFRRNDGGEEGASMMFLYDPIKRASDKKMQMQTEATKAVKAMFTAHGMKDWHKRQYQFGTSVLTKEQVIVLALNWGTEINRKRVMDGYNVTEEEVMDTLSNLDEKDWRLVNALWNQIGSYWADTVAVEERMTGVGLEKQQALPFTVTDKRGNIHHIAGGYYPIMYDPAKSRKAADQQDDDLAKQQMSGNVVLGTRRGHTKSRVQGIVDRKVHLTLAPLSRALDDVIHNICYREAVRDVNKLISNEEVAAALEEAYGIQTARSLSQWVRDNWAVDDRKDGFAQVAATLRRNMTMAVMGWRVSTALLNLTNVFPMMEYLGVKNTLGAVMRFMRDPQREWRECRSRSVFLAERAQTMDRDVREKLTADRNTAKGKVAGWFGDHAFSMMAHMDLLFAVPLWQSEYRRVWQEQSAKGLAPEVIEQQAVTAGDAAVRRVFGSGDVKDLAPVQRGNEVTKGLTMYYSYMNTVFNALAFRGSQVRDKRSKKEWYNFARSVLYWCILTRVTEEFLRALWGDDEDELADRLKKAFDPARLAQSAGEQITGMIPVARDIFKLGIDVIVDGRAYDANLTSAYDVASRTVRFAQKLTSKKADWIDVMRDGNKMVNAYTGWNDTLTDAVWTFARYADDGFDEDVADWIKATIFDKKLK